MARTILVTGGAGFIGSHVAEALIARGDRVVCVDNFDDYYDPQIKRDNVRLLEGEQFQLYELDIRDRAGLHELARTESLDAIIHLAARAGVRASIEEPVLYSQVNLIGTMNMLELARESEVRDFVFASSSSVYGERNRVPFKETDAVDRPVSPYAATKRAGEVLAASYHELYDLNIACLRFFTVYGPRQRPEMAISTFTRRIEAGEPIPVFGDGSARRDFTFVTDIVDGVLRALDQNRGYDIYNLGNHRMVSVREIIDLIADKVGQPANLEFLPHQAGDVSVTCADVSHARERLGYEPSTPIDEGISNYVEWYLTSKVIATQ